MMACSDLSRCQNKMTLPAVPPPETPHESLRQELASIRSRLDQLHQSVAQPNLQPVMMQIDRLVEGQVAMQKSLAYMQESIGSMQPSKVEPRNGDKKMSLRENTLNGISMHSPKRGNSSTTRTLNANTLKKIFVVDDEEAQRKKAEKEIPLVKRFVRDTVMEIEVLDSFAAFVIIANTIFMGVRLDLDDDTKDYWLHCDIVFTVLFVLELVLRVVIKGCYNQFCIEDKFPRFFDAVLICMDVAQVVLDTVGDKSFGGYISVSLFRIVRLSRFIRVIRLSRMSWFKDLVAMMQGMVGGSRTLGWAAFLFGLLVYVAALLCREAFGRKDVEHVFPYFENVPRSMFTVFRCSFGDCSSAGGVPIFEHVSDHYGGVYALVYCFFVFALTIGFFNVISAIFVDGAMAAAADANARRQQERLSSVTRKSVNVAIIIKQVLAAAGKTTKDYGQCGDIEVDRRILDQLASADPAMQDPLVVQALDELDIDPHDHSKLSDILDPDHGGTVTVLDLVMGLMALRGNPRRSDIVSVNLMIRSLQDRLEELFDRLRGT